MVGEYVADIIANELTILELKSILGIVRAHGIQLVNCLITTEKPVGLMNLWGKNFFTFKP